MADIRRKLERDVAMRMKPRDAVVDLSKYRCTDNMGQPTYAMKDPFYGAILDRVAKGKSKQSGDSTKDS